MAIARARTTPRPSRKRRDIALEAGFLLRVPLEPFEERDPAGDAAVPPRSPGELHAVALRPRSPGRRRRSGSRPGRVDGSAGRTGAGEQVAVQVEVRRTIRPDRRRRPCCRRRRPVARTGGRDGRRRARSTGPGGSTRRTPGSHRSATVGGTRRASQGSVRDPRLARGDAVGQEREHAQAPHEEEAEVEEMTVGNMADLVAEDRRDLERASWTRSGHRSARHSGIPARSPVTQALTIDVPGIPDQDVGEPEADALGDALEPAARAARRAGSASARPAG